MNEQQPPLPQDFGIGSIPFPSTGDKFERDDLYLWFKRAFPFGLRLPGTFLGFKTDEEVKIDQLVHEQFGEPDEQPYASYNNRNPSEIVITNADARYSRAREGYRFRTEADRLMAAIALSDFKPEMVVDDTPWVGAWHPSELGLYRLSPESGYLSASLQVDFAGQTLKRATSRGKNLLVQSLISGSYEPIGNTKVACEAYAIIFERQLYAYERSAVQLMPDGLPDRVIADLLLDFALASVVRVKKKNGRFGWVNHQKKERKPRGTWPVR